MGRFIYDTLNNSIDIEDRTLAHLRIVMMNKLRRSESFMFTVDLDSEGISRRSFWMHPSVPLQFAWSRNRKKKCRSTPDNAGRATPVNLRPPASGSVAGVDLGLRAALRLRPLLHGTDRSVLDVDVLRDDRAHFDRRLVLRRVDIEVLGDQHDAAR